MAGKNLPKPQSETISTGNEGDSVPLIDNAKENAPNKSKELSGNNRGHKAGKKPGGAR